MLWFRHERGVVSYSVVRAGSMCCVWKSDRKEETETDRQTEERVDGCVDGCVETYALTDASAFALQQLNSSKHAYLCYRISRQGKRVFRR
jgi:hypothetical protein